MNLNLSDALNKEDVLSRLTEYELYKENSRIFIRINELLGKPEKAEIKYIAIPHLVIKEAKEEFIGKGNSAEAALMDCLMKIKDHSIDSILSPST